MFSEQPSDRKIEMVDKKTKEKNFCGTIRQELEHV